jgi:hypothetical protein
MLELLAEISPKNRVLVTYHNAFSYLAERYGFEVAEFLVENPEAEPSPRDLGRLVELLRNLSKPVVFTEPQLTSGTRYVQALARARFQHPQQNADGGSFPRSIWPYKAVNLATAHNQVQSIKSLYRAEALPQVYCLHNRHSPNLPVTKSALAIRAL